MSTQVRSFNHLWHSRFDSLSCFFYLPTQTTSYHSPDLTMAKPRIYVLDPYHPDAIAALQSNPSIDLILPTFPHLSNWRTDATALLLRSETHLTPSLLANPPPTLRHILKQGVGTDNIDLPSARAAGIRVYNTPALNAEAVAELALTLALSLARRVPELDRRLRRGETLVRSNLLGISLHRKTLGIVGMGNVGSALARKWRGAMEGEVLGYDPYANEGAWTTDANDDGEQAIPHTRVHDLHDLLRSADVISLHVPLSPSTRNLIGATELSLMKPTVILLNTSRGGVVDEAALTKVLKEKRLWGAALDACVSEPPSAQAYADLLECENVLITPHVGASTRENQSRSGVAVVETLWKVLEGGEVPNRVV